MDIFMITIFWICGNGLLQAYIMIDITVVFFLLANESDAMTGYAKKIGVDRI